MPTIKPSPLERDAAALYDAATVFIRHYQFRRRDHGLRHGLTVVQAYAIDLLLASGGDSLTGLALALQLDKSTASRVVAGMERHGLIAWSRPEHDRRGKLIVASREGTRRYQRLRRAIIRDNARLLAAYSATERRAILSALRQLAARAQPA
jgi:DNA-binding MarR family transcriptional regulator